MVPGIPTIGVRFDIELVGGGAYGFAAWKIFWSAIDPQAIAGARLFDGDTDATLKDRENVYCIALQCSDPRTVDKIKAALRNHDGFRKVADSMMFADGNACVREPLADCGSIDARGKLVGKDSHAAAALAAVHKQRAAKAPAAAQKRRKAKPWWKVWG